MDDRLRYVAARVRPGSVVADIGTDHAGLPVYLVGSGICPRAVAGDVRRAPAQRALAAVQAAGLTDRIEVRVGDGLSVLRPGEATDIVLAGMGGDTIAAILAAAPWIRDPAVRLILQPMTRPEKMRAFLLENGFSLLEESTVASAGRRYLVTVAAYTGAAPDRREWKKYVGVLDPATEGDWLRRRAALLRARQAGLLAAGDADGARQAAGVAEQIERYCEGGSV